MLDIKQIRKAPKEIEQKLKKKDPTITLSSILELDEKIRTMQSETENLKFTKNTLSKEIGELKKEGQDQVASKKTTEVTEINDKISKIDQELKILEDLRTTALSVLPNIPQDDIPVSLDPKDNVCIKTFKEKRTFDFPFKNHLELNEKLGLFDFTAGAKLAGTGWPLYKNLGARLEWALLNYMLDIHIQNGFSFILPPVLTKKEIMYGSGQLPKFEDQLFKIQDNDYNLYLIPTAETALNGISYGEILDENTDKQMDRK